jgi:hypothetical protein
MDAPRQSQVPRPRPTAKKTPVVATSDIATAAHLETDDAVNAHLLRQSRVSRPTAKLIDGNNHEKAALTFQRAAVAAEIARVEAVEASTSHAAAATGSISASAPSPLASTPSPQPSLSDIYTGTCTGSSDSSFTRESSITGNQTEDELDEGPRVTQSKNKRRQIISSDEDDDEAPTGKKKKKKKVNSSCKFLLLNFGIFQESDS